MTDILIRDVPPDVIAALDARAARLGISRNEYLRRRIAQDGSGDEAGVTAADLRAFSETFAGLADAKTMGAAWA